MHLRVVDRQGAPISLPKSFVRYFVLSAPIFLNNLRLPVTRTPEIVTYLTGLAVFGLLPITVYLVLFKRRTRQGLHDLAAGSYVADADKSGPLAVLPIWKGHWAILGALIVAGAIAGKVLETKLKKLADFPAMFANARVAESLDHVQFASVSDLTWASSSSDEKKRIYEVEVFWSGTQGQEEEFAKQIASRILENDPAIADRDILRIVIVRGYDLGITTSRRSHAFEASPTGWKARLQGQTQP